MTFGVVEPDQFGDFEPFCISQSTESVFFLLRIQMSHNRRALWNEAYSATKNQVSDPCIIPQQQLITQYYYPTTKTQNKLSQKNLKMGKKIKSASKRQSIPKADAPDFDINSFIQEQQLEIDPEVAPLLANSTPAPQKKSKRTKLMESITPVEAEEEDINDSEDDKEMMAYMELLQAKDAIVDRDDLQEKVYTNRTVS